MPPPSWPEKLDELPEAAYAVDMEDAAWLNRVSVAGRDVWGRSSHIFSSVFDTPSDVGNIRATLLVTDGISQELADILLQSSRLATPELSADLPVARTAVR